MAKLNFDTFNLSLIVIGVFSVFCGLLLMGFRLWLLLRFKRFSVSYKNVLAITLTSSFLGVFLPGLAGGDAVKAAYLCGNVTERRMDAFSTVFIDRLLGLYSLLLLGTLVSLLSWIFNVLPFKGSILLLSPMAALVSGAGMFLIFWDKFYNAAFIQRCRSKLPKKLISFLEAIRAYHGEKRLLAKVIMLSFLNHSMVVVSFIIAGLLLKDNTTILSHFILNPLAMIMNIIPLTPGGIGITESAFSFLYQMAGSPNGATVALTGRLVQYTAFILSGSIAISLLKVRSHILTVD